MSEILTKSQFAELAGVTPGRVSQWIAEGKLTGPALVGEGRSARINVTVASEQLRLKLDINQRFGLNGLTTVLPSPSPSRSQVNSSQAALPTEDRMQAPQEMAKEDPVETRIKAEKLRQAELVTARFEREDREARGIYMRTDDARSEMFDIAGTLFSIFEGSITNFASSIAGRFELPIRDVQHLLQQQFREVRSRASEKLRKEQIDIPETVLDAPDKAAEPVCD